MATGGPARRQSRAPAERRPPRRRRPRARARRRPRRSCACTACTSSFSSSVSIRRISVPAWSSSTGVRVVGRMCDLGRLQLDPGLSSASRTAVKSDGSVITSNTSPSERHVLGPGVDGGHQVVLGVARGVHHQLALLLEQVVDRAGLAQVAVELGEGVADLGAGAVAVVGQRVDQQRHPAGPVALVDDPLEGLGVLIGPGALVDGPLDVVLGHRVVLGLLHGQGERRVALDVSPALTRRDGDRARELGEQRAALGVGGALLVLDRGPFGVTGHGRASLERLRPRTCRRARAPAVDLDHSALAQVADHVPVHRGVVGAAGLGVAQRRSAMCTVPPIFSSSRISLVPVAMP